VIGVGQTISLLVPARTGSFASAEKPAPLVRTADTAEASTVLAFLGCYTPSNVAGAQSLHWRSGGASIFRSVEIHGRGNVAPAPVIISGHGGAPGFVQPLPRGPGVAQVPRAFPRGNRRAARHHPQHH
jgi:hypothetical protein